MNTRSPLTAVPTPAAPTTEVAASGLDAGSGSVRGREKQQLAPLAKHVAPRRAALEADAPPAPPFKSIAWQPDPGQLPGRLSLAAHLVCLFGAELEQSILRRDHG